MLYCRRCVTPSSRPRVEFNSDGICNACLWHERKQTEIDWKAKWSDLQEICDHFHDNAKEFDCIVPCSGGKDGSYVAWRLKHDLGMHPLCITFRPQMRTWIGWRNLENFKDAGFDHLEITPDAQLYRKMSRDYFINQGRPKWPFVMGISSAIFKVAKMFNIPLIVYGEHGEIEYGGKQEVYSLQRMSREFLIDIYYEGNDPSHYGSWWNISDLNLDDLFVTWWSLWEDWDPQVHAKYAKEHTGFEMIVGGSIGTFTNYAQLDDNMQDLHAYLMFCKFGFGRCTSDSSIEIRRGRMTREQGVEVVNKLDGTFPLEYLPAYLDYLDVTEREFWSTIEKFANKELLQETGDKVRPWILKEKIR